MVFVNVTKGLTNTDSTQLELMSSYAASDWTVLRSKKKWSVLEVQREMGKQFGGPVPPPAPDAFYPPLVLPPEPPPQ